VNLRPIGVIHTPYQQAAGTPVQGAMAAGVAGTVEVSPDYAAGLRDLAGFERIWLVYWFDRANPAEMVVTPYLDTEARGLFATRAPCRPNPIGLSAVRLVRIEENVVHVDGVDMLDGTPLLDIKPYIPAFDAFQAERIGWLAGAGRSEAVADGRFENENHPEQR
jgi:tRNA-Thr(GGU) m(6)t(6)A37 methyltransferase TsaA